MLQLRAFLYRMPKGGVHNHLSDAAYAETLIELERDLDAFER